MNLILSNSAFHQIERECLSYPEVETGGILIGQNSCEDIIVPFVVSSGPGAQRSRVRFSPDVNWQQNLLARYFKNYGVNYVGSFHRHFGNLSSPSSIDYRTAIQILCDPDWAVNHAVFPIILVQETAIEIYPYYICRDNPRFQLMPMGLVPDHDPLISAITKQLKGKGNNAQSLNA